MVLNEAAAAALPIVAGDAAGAAWSLVDDGVSGFRVPSGDAPALAQALAALAADPALRERAGARSAALGAEHSAEAWAAGVARLARKLAAR
jgi:glycosyltransferase involved in cell wall biosynthesis